MTFEPLAILDQLVRFYSWMIIAYVLTSWFPGSGLVADVRRVLAQLVEPYLSIFRRLVPMVGVGGGGIDFSPIIALFALQLGWRYLLLPLLAGLL